MFRVLRGLTMDGVYHAPGAVIGELPEGRLWLIECGALEKIETTEAAEPQTKKRGRPRKEA